MWADIHNMEVWADPDWVLRAIGDGIPGAIAVFETGSDGVLRLMAANDGYFSLFEEEGPELGEVVVSILPGGDPQIAKVVESARGGESFFAESWALAAPRGTYSTGVAYCDWSLRPVEFMNERALVLVLTDATRRTERNVNLAEEVIRLRDALSLT